MTLALNQPAGNEQKSCAFFQADRRGLAGGMREEAQGKSGRGKLGYSSFVANQARGVAGIRITERAEFLVIAGNESGARMDAAAYIDQSTIEPQAKVGHGVGFVDIGFRKKFQSRRTENLLSVDEDVAIILARSGDIEESDEDAFGAGADGVVEVSSHPFTGEDGSDVGAVDLGKDCRNGLDNGRCGLGIAETGQHARTPSEN